MFERTSPPQDINTGEAEGWVLSGRDDGYWEIQKFDEDKNNRFSSDFEAYVYVKSRADAGSAIHKRAIEWHGTKND